jgi:hypothetical protein
MWRQIGTGLSWTIKAGSKVGTPSAIAPQVLSGELITSKHVAIDFNVNVLFTFEYLLRLYAAYDRVDYLRNFLRMVEFLVLLPSWMDFAGRVNGATLPTTTLTQSIHGLRPLRILRSYRFLDFTTSSLQRQIVAAMLTVVCITVSTAGILQVVEHCSAHKCFDSPRTCGCQNLTMLDFIYFVVVSISTLGYGDITPESPVGKFLIAFIILLTFLLVPIQVNRIGAIVSSHTDYSSSYTEFKHHPHVVITGHIEAETLSAFVREFFHASNLNWNEKIVILNTRPPTVEIKKLINLVDGKIKYLVGSPMLDEDLERAVIHRASACFVLVNRNARRAQYADQCTALITIALRRGNPTCPIYAQVINAQNSSTILKMGASDVIVEGLMKSSILGRSCEVYGLPTLLSNLLSQSHPDMDKHHSSIQWQKPYLHGYLHNIYMVDIPRTFSGYTFGDLIRFLFEKAAVLPIAMLTENGVQFIDLEFKLGATADPNLCCKVYALAKGHTAIDRIMEIPPEQILSYRKTLRRKVMSEADPLAEEQQAAERKKIKPALGSELELIREAMISMYAIANKFYSEDAMNADYEEFISVGVPPSIEKHIIVCGFPADTFQFLKTIHEAPPIDDALGPPSVVFLTPAELDEDEYAKIQCFRQVYFVLGSPVNFADLRRTRIETASSVLILTKATGSAYADPNMVDADAITTLRYIVEISQRTRMPNLVVELERATNVKLLSSLANDRRVSASATLPVTVSRQLSYRTARRASVRRDSFWSGADDPSSSNVASSSSTIMLEEYIASGTKRG